MLSFAYSLASQPLTEVSEYNYVGITLANNLSWNSHISYLGNCAFQKLCQLRHKLKHSPVEARHIAYTSLLRAQLEYATIYDMGSGYVDAIDMIQSKAVKPKAKYRLTNSPSQLMIDHNIETLDPHTLTSFSPNEGKLSLSL